MSETRPNYSPHGKAEHQVLKSLRTRLHAARIINWQNDDKTDDLKEFEKKFDINKGFGEIQEEMKNLMSDKNWKDRLKNDKKYLAHAIEITLMRVIQTSVAERIDPKNSNSLESLEFMNEVDGVFRGEDDKKTQKIRAGAVEILSKKYNDATNRASFVLDNEKETKNVIEPYKEGNKLNVGKIIKEGNHDVLASLLLETDIKNLDKEYKKAGLETEIKETKVEAEEEDMTPDEDKPEKEIHWNWDKISSLTIATFSTAAVSTAVISQGLVISGLMPEISSELTRIAMGTAGAGLLGAAGFLGLKFLRRNLRASTVEASVTPEPVILAVVPDSLRKTVEGLTTKKDLKLSGIAYKVGDETAANQDLINHTAPIADCLRENTLFVLPVILYGHTADDIDEANTHLMVFINNNQYKISIAGNDFDTLFLNNLNNDANEKPRLNIITAINEIHRANSLNPIGITFGSYLLYNNSLTMAGLNDLITDIRDKKIGLDHFISNSTIVYTR